MDTTFLGRTLRVMAGLVFLFWKDGAEALS